MRRKFSGPVMRFAQKQSPQSRNKSWTHNNAQNPPNISNSAYARPNALLKSLFVTANSNLNVWNVNKCKKLKSAQKSRETGGRLSVPLQPFRPGAPFILFIPFSINLPHNRGKRTETWINPALDLHSRRASPTCRWKIKFVTSPGSQFCVVYL